MAERRFNSKKKSAKKSSEDNAERVYLDLAAVGAVVTHARESDYGTTFTLKCKGFSLYGLRVVEKRDGGYFIAPPSHKGSNGKYYADYALYLSDADTERLLDMVEQALELDEDVIFA